MQREGIQGRNTENTENAENAMNAARAGSAETQWMLCELLGVASCTCMLRVEHTFVGQCFAFRQHFIFQRFLRAILALFLPQRGPQLICPDGVIRANRQCKGAWLGKVGGECE